MEKQIGKNALKLLFIILLLGGCEKQVSFNDEYVMQINNVGLRPGVFIRRYKLTRNYGNNKVFTPEILKQYIKEVLEPEYLFIQDAYEKRMDKESITFSKINDYKITLLAASHPVNYEKITITKEELRNFYQKKLVKYNIDLVQTNSFSMADSIYQLIQQENEIKNNKEEPGFSFPRYLLNKEIAYGDLLHPEIFSTLEKMREGETCEPVYAASTWTIIRLNKKRKTRESKSFDDMEKDLLRQRQAISKYEQQKQLVNQLREKYQVSIRTEFYQPLISAYTFMDNHGWIDRNKIDKTPLNNTFLTINNDEIPLANFIANFNQTGQFMQSRVLAKKDLDHVVDDYITQFFLYLDALEKGVAENNLIKDKLENKEHKILLTKYLKEEIVQKVIITDAEARKHYNNTRDKWQANYNDVASSVKHELKNKRLLEKKDEFVHKLRKKYKVRYNETRLQEIAKQLTGEKSTKKES